MIPCNGTYSFRTRTDDGVVLYLTPSQGSVQTWSDWTYHATRDGDIQTLTLQRNTFLSFNMTVYQGCKLDRRI